MSVTISPSLSPAAQSFIPMLYLAWSDSVLSPSEIKIIRDKLDRFEFLSSEDRRYLHKWTDPKSAPSAKDFKRWRLWIAKHVASLDGSGKNALINMGMQIAKSGEGTDRVSSEEVRNALAELYKSLGLSDSSVEGFLQGLHVPVIPDETRIYGIDVSATKELLDGDYGELKDRIRRLLQDPEFAIRHYNDKEVHRQKVLEQLKKLAVQGLSAYSFPEKYGGYEQNGAHIAVFEMLGYADLSLAIKFGVQFGLFGGAVYMLGTEKHHKKYVEALHKAELLGCFAMTETGHGSNVKNLETTATYNQTGKILTIHSPNHQSGKEYIGNAMHSELAVVFAQLIVNQKNHGVHAVVVPLRNKNGDLLPGIKVEDNGYKMGLNGVDNGRIWFDKVEVPVDNLLNKYGDINAEGKYTSPIQNPSKRFFTMLGALVVGRICVGLLGLNAAKVALTIAVKYGNKRRQFAPSDGQPETIIMDYPSHQKRLLPLLARNYAYYFALSDLAAQYATADASQMREIETFAAGLKAKATWYATECIQTCREACGGKGYLTENRFAALKADSDIFTTFEGDNTVLMQLVAKGLMTEFKQNFHDDGYRAVLRILLTKVQHETYENNPLFTRNTDSSHLLDSNFHFHALKYRKKKTLIALSERMRTYLKRGVDPYQAFLKVQNHMIDLAHAYIDLTALKSFHNHLEKVEDETTKEGLTRLAALYALETIQENKGWYLETDYLTGTKTKAIRRVINKLYTDIRPYAELLTDAFAIPDELIAAEIIDN